jgi:dGTPase
VAEDRYTRADAGRWVAEPPKDPRRGAFPRDRARVVHSSALRRLAAKTQVMGAGTDDFARNRLTHSLEVAQVGRELGQLLGCDPDVVDTACLAHDLGHPPFGHNGEAALDVAAAAIGGFEGNAQTLRLLTRLEPKVVHPVTGRSAGLNLTRASLDACMKYPWLRDGGPAGAASGKFGAYGDDIEVFSWLREGAPPGRRCVEAQVMDLADDVAYSVHDVEDAVVGGYLDPRVFADPDEVERVAGQVRSWYLPDLADGELAEAVRRLRAVPAFPTGFDGGHRALASLKDMTSRLVGRFTGAVEVATRARSGGGRLTRYAADVIIPRPTLVEIAALKGAAAVWVMAAESRQPSYAREREMITELVGALRERAPEGLDLPFAAFWAQSSDGAGRLRVIIDQVASLTDTSALARLRLLHPSPPSSPLW